MQNAAARLLTSTRKYDHITPVLHELHWLPVRYRIHFKILLLTFRAIHGIAPHYISNLINVRQPVSYSLRSCASTVLVFPKGKMLSIFGDRTLSMAAPKLWNALPAKLRSISSLSVFKSSLTTHLFKLAFDIEDFL